MSGRIQLYVTADAIGASAHDAFKHWDLGDIVGADGPLFRTKTGELSVKVTRAAAADQIAAPAAGEVPRPADQEQKYRQRYLDLITNEDTRDVFVMRSQIDPGDPRVLRRAAATSRSRRR